MKKDERYFIIVFLFQAPVGLGFGVKLYPPETTTTQRRRRNDQRAGFPDERALSQTNIGEMT